MVLSPFRADASGSIVYRYFFLASAFHCLIAARPLYVWPSSRTMASSAKHREKTSLSPPSAARYTAMGFGKCTRGSATVFVICTLVLSLPDAEDGLKLTK